MRLYTVEITREVVVLASSREDAESIADDERHDIESDNDPDVSASLMTAFPGAWDDGCLPYHALARGDGRADWTIGQWRAFLAEQEAEEARVAAFNARQVPLPGVG